MKKISGIVFLFFALLSICTDVMAIELIKTSPHGKPILVMDAAGNFSIPIKVYSDSALEMFIPNITDPGWVSWNKDEFRKEGTYKTVIYDYFLKDSYCLQKIIPDLSDRRKLCSRLRYRRRHILVDTRNKNVTMLEVIMIEKDARWQPENVRKLNSTYPLTSNSTLSKETLSSIAKITAIVEKEVKKAGNTQSAQDVMRHNREMTSRMAVAGRQSSGKSMTDVHCELDCYPGSEYYNGMHLYNAENCKQKCTSQKPEETQNERRKKQSFRSGETNSN